MIKELSVPGRGGGEGCYTTKLPLPPPSKIQNHDDPEAKCLKKLFQNDHETI